MNMIQVQPHQSHQSQASLAVCYKSERPSKNYQWSSNET